MNTPSHDIAVIGMACLFPGSGSLRAYWENIVAARCCISDCPQPGVERLLDPHSPDFDRLYTIRGGFLGELATFNPVEFGIMPDSVKGGDPNHFLALRVARDALADAGLLNKDFPRHRTDVILGHGSYVNPGNANWIQHGLVVDQMLDLAAHLRPDYTPADLQLLRQEIRKGLPPLGAQTVPALITNILAGRIANRFDLMGANHIVDAACASSLVAMDQGINNLLLNKSDIVLAGGVLACMPPQGLMVFVQLKALSRQPALRPFDRAADGTMLGEGVGMVVLKRRADAERDGDRIYAVIKGIGISSDGRATGPLAPRLEGECLAIRRAYEQAGIAPDSVGLVEAHGTGIPLGDATEVRALRSVLGGRQGRFPTCALGSVKSMIGHTISAAGVAGFIKAALALHHRILPPTLNCTEPHPDLELEQTPFYINTEARPWIHASATPRRAAVSAMGFGGINAHCVIEEYPSPEGSA
jgi:acyl transferase domain-containing protein